MRCAFLILLLGNLHYCYSFSGVFWHICDIHLNISYNTSQRNNESFGKYGLDSPITLVKSAINAMYKIKHDPDFIIWNGDNVAHIRENNVTFLKSVRIVTQELKDKFPDSLVIPTLGNHDINPTNDIGHNSTWCKELYNIWKIFFNNSTQKFETFKRGCFYSTIVNSRNQSIKIIALNTILWYSVNKDVYNVDDPFGQLQWLKVELQDARRDNLKVLVIGHVPPGSSEYNPELFKHLYPRFNKRFLEILQQNSDIIDAGFFSHEHTDSFKVVYSTKNIPILSLFLSPSVTPFHLTNMGTVNPSIRLYTWPKDPSGRFYSQFHTSLSTDSKKNLLNWTLEYNSTDILPSLSPSHLDHLLTDLQSKNSLYFDKFFKWHLSGRPHDFGETCPLNSSCRCNIICGMKHIDYGMLDFCLSSCHSLSTMNRVPLIIGIIVVFVLILIATVIGVNKVYCHRRNKGSLTRDLFVAKPNGKDREQIIADHINDIAEITFGDVPEYKGHFRNNSRTILTLNDGNENQEKSVPPVSKFAMSSRPKKSHEKYEYSRM